MSTRFKPLKVPDQWNHYFTKYPQGFTILESLIEWVSQVDGLTNNVNSWNDYLDEFVETFDVELRGKVVATLEEWQESGLLDIVIGEALQTEIDVVRGKLDKAFTYDTEPVNKIYVHAQEGNDGNTGEEGSPFRTLTKALNYLRSLSDIALEGKYEVHLAGTFTSGHKIENLPRFRFPIKFLGGVDTNGQPITIFDGETAVRKIGMWFEPLRDLDVVVENIIFRNYASGFNGYGLLAKGHGNIVVRNCRAENCDIGFAAIRNVDFTFEKCVAVNCAGGGFRTQYSSSGTFGNPTLGLSSACEAINCDQGFHVSRNSVAHIDYCIADGATYAGVFVDIASRAHVMGTILRNNKYGVRTEGTGEWFNNTASPNTFSNNEVNYGHFGSSRETRLYSQTSQNEYRQGVSLDRHVVTGTTRTQVYGGSAIGKIPANFFLDPNKRARIVVHGHTVGTTSGSVLHELVSVDSTGGTTAILQTINENNRGAFKIEYILYPYNGGVHIVSQISVNGTSYPRVYNRDVSIDLTKERWFRTYATIDNTDFTTTFTSFEMYLMG